MQENERLVTTEIRINREHKDRLFRLIFGKEEYKQNLLELYNALNDTSYNNLDDLKITTIEDVVYMGMKNDVSMLIHSRMTLFEHQSTYNPNMPIRGFMYAARLFYNGDEEHEDEEILCLSDAFETIEGIEGYEWTARMLNINYRRNL